MNPLHLSASNLRTFERLELDLPAGCVVIGGSNGAGKSTILNAIDVALFCSRGELPGLLTLGEDELALALTFEHAGELYRVRRGYSDKGRGKTTCDLERFNDQDWHALTRETAEQTQQHLEQILGLSRATFRASSFLAQGDGAAFTEASPRDRKAILAEILGLEVWDRLLTQARADLRAAEDETVAARARIAQLDVELAGVEALSDELAAARLGLADRLERKRVAETLLEQAQLRLADNLVAAERARAAEQQFATATEARERARQEYARTVQAGIDQERRQAELDSATAAAAQIEPLEAELAEAHELAAQVARGQRLREEADQRDLARRRLAEQADTLQATAAEQERKADHLEAHIDDAGDCDRCGQTLGAEAAARAAASFRADAAELRERAAAIMVGDAAEQTAIADLLARAKELLPPAAALPDIAALEQHLTVARAAQQRAAGLAEQLRQLAEQASRSAELAIELADADAAHREARVEHALVAANVSDTDVLQQAVNTGRAAVVFADKGVTQAREALTRLEATLERLTVARQERSQIGAELDDQQQLIDVYRLAERAYGRDGIPALIVENAAIPQLEVEANRILGELGGATADCRIELRTQRALKTTEALRETLDIIIVTPSGARPYETFSGGERTRLNLSLRIALARLLAHRRGAESRLLAIDEPEFLDEAGVGRLADVLRGLSGDFDRVLLVSHHPTLAAAFDDALVVVRDGGRSRVLAGVADMVTA